MEQDDGKKEKEINLLGCSLNRPFDLEGGRPHYGSREPRPLNSVGVFVEASPVQVVPPHVVVLEHPHQLDVLADEAGGQQAVGAQLQTLLQGERHALPTEEAVSVTPPLYTVQKVKIPGCIRPAESQNSKNKFDNVLAAPYEWKEE